VKAGHWVLLDELNLAGQSVLEGLNGLLDHRAALFVPELGQSFKAHPNFRLFAAQNPLQEGGGRKGLPKSFLNRFTRVAVELLQPEDLVSIATALHPELPGDLILRMVQLLTAMQAAAGSSSSSGRVVPFAVAGGPWEFNLRDLLRWCELVTLFAQQQQQQQQRGTADAMEVDAPQQQQHSVCSDALLDAAAEHYLGVLFTQRLRTAADRQRLQGLFAAVWGRRLTAASSTNVLPDLQQSLAVSSAAAEGSSAAAAAEADSAAMCSSRPSVIVTPGELCVGMARISRAMGAAAAAAAATATAAAAAVGVQPSVAPSATAGSSSKAARGQQQQQQLLLPGWQAPLLESVVSSLSAGWMVLLVGPSGSGKTSLARLAAGLVGVELQELGLTQGTDTSDLLGSFEQVRPRAGGNQTGGSGWVLAVFLDMQPSCKQ
jgi:midasin